MPEKEKYFDKKLIDLLEVKNMHSLDNDKFILLLGMVNLMSVINLLGERSAGGEEGSGMHRFPSSSEMAPFINKFGGSKGKS